MSGSDAFHLQLFGLPHIADADGQTINVRGRKSVALLGYLVLTHPQVHSRERLAGLFWPEMTDKAARNNLRVSLARITKCLLSTDSPVLVADRLTVSFNPDASLRCDARDFLNLLVLADEHDHTDQLSCEHCQKALDRAAALYTADFMQGLQLDDCEAFEEWQQATREQLRIAAITTVTTMAQYAEQQGNLASVERLARQVISLDAYREDAHRRLMAALARNGDQAAAITHYKHMRLQLQNELGAKPDETTQALVSAIENGELKQEYNSGPLPGAEPCNRTSPNNLPVDKTPYIGNKQILDELITHMTERRLVRPNGAT